MVSLGDVKRWNAGALDSVGQTLRQRQAVLLHSGDDFARTIPVAGWQGAAADNAASVHRSLVSPLDHLAAGASIVTKTIQQAADAIPAVQRAITDAEELARKYGFAIRDDGSIADVLTHPGPLDPSPADRTRPRQEVIDAIAQAMRTATEIDNDLASVLTRATHGGFGTGNETTVSAAAADGTKNPGEVLPTPPANGTPSQNAAWWNTLSPAAQAILLHDHPDWLGNLNGLPGAVRSQANMARLPALRAQVQAEIDQLTRKLNNTANDPLRWLDIPLDESQLRDAEATLASLNTIGQVMTQQPPRQLLTLDLSGQRAEAAIAVGNVDTAEHVAVFVPGITTTVNGSLSGYDGDMQQLRDASQKIAKFHGDGGQVATVTWIGYQAPQWAETPDVLGNSVLTDNAARAGATKLDGFLSGIGASHGVQNQPLHLTALGHSYGSLTTGIALQHDTPVKDAVVFGSPGIDALSVGQLHVPAGHVYAEWAPNDPVPSLDIAGWFGLSPYNMPGVQDMPTGPAISPDGQPLQGSTGHSEYLKSQSTSQYNMATIVAGRPDLRIH